MLHFIRLKSQVFIGLNDIKWAHVKTSFVYNLNIKSQKNISRPQSFFFAKFKILKVYFISSK